MKKKKNELKNESAAIWSPISELKEWDKNPRNNEDAIDKVAASIKRFGFASPIIARKQDGMIIAGHTRFKAALKLNLEFIPVRYLDLDPVDAKLLAIADNKVGEIASWNEDLLKETLSELKDHNLDEIGFTNEELDSLFSEVSEIFEPEQDKELDLKDFTDFEHKCPRCGFEWDQ